MKDERVTIKIDRALYKKLQYLKLDKDAKSISDVIKLLLDKYD